MFTEAFPIVTVPDLPETVAFYRDLLGFRESYRFPAEGEPRFVTLKLGTSELGLGADEASGPAAGYALCVYAVDCDRAVEKLRRPARRWSRNRPTCRGASGWPG